MSDERYYPFRLTATVLTDSDFGFGSGVFGGWASELEENLNGTDSSQQGIASYPIDVADIDEETEQDFEVNWSESVNVSSLTEKLFTSMVSDEISLSDIINFLINVFLSDTVSLSDSTLQEIGFSDSIETYDVIQQEFENHYTDQVYVWEYDQNYLDKAKPTASGSFETKPTASGSFETKPTASGFGIKDVEDE